MQLADDAKLRATLGAVGARRARTVLDWRIEEASLLAAYEKVFAGVRAIEGVPAAGSAGGH